MKKQEQADELRPRLPWLSRVGTKNGELTSTGHMLRGGAALLALVNPIATATMWLCVLALSRTRVKGWWLSLGGGVVLVVAAWAGWVVKYNAMWRELAAAVGASLVAQVRQVTAGEAVSASVGDQWSAIGAQVPTWLAWQVPVGVALGVCVAGFVLSYRARYSAPWRRKTPTASRRAVARALERIDATGRRAAPAPERADDVELRLGVDVATAKVVTLAGSALRMHTVVAGPTGFGKSTTVQRIIDGLVAAPEAQGARIGAVLVDMKADPEMVAFLRRTAAAGGRRFHLLTVSPVTSGRYNPIARGDAAQIASKLIESEANAADGGFSEPHYRRLGERYLLLCARVLLDLVEREAVDTFDGARRPWRRDLPDLVRLMRPQLLAKQVDRLSTPVARSLKGYLEEMQENKDLTKDVYGIYTRFALIADGPAGSILVHSPDDLDVLDAMRAGDVVCASLDAQTDVATARHIGNLLIQDITHSFAQLAEEGFGARGGMVWCGVDEFSALGGSLLTNLYARGRSAGAAVALASQDLDGDLNAVDPAFRTQVLTNANVVVLHQQRGESPDTWANAIGTRVVWKETIQVIADTSVLGPQEASSGVGSLREAHEYVVAPDTLRNLPQGRAVVLIGHPTKQVRVVAIARAPQRATTDESAAGTVEAAPAAAVPAHDEPTAPSVAATPPVSAGTPRTVESVENQTSGTDRAVTVAGDVDPHEVDDLDDVMGAPVVEPVD